MRIGQKELKEQVSAGTIDKELWARKAPILPYLFWGAMIMQIISLVSEMLSMGNYFGQFMNPFLGNVASFAIAFGWEFLMRVLLMFATLEAYAYIKKKEKFQWDDGIVLGLVVMGFLALGATSLFMSKQGTDDSFGEAGLEKHYNKKNDQLASLMTSKNAEIATALKPKNAEIKRIEGIYASKNSLLDIEFNAKKAGIDEDIKFWSNKKQPYTSKIKGFKQEIDALKATKEAAKAANIDAMANEIAKVNNKYEIKESAIISRYDLLENEAGEGADQYKSFVNLFSGIISFIAGFSVVMFSVFHVIYVLLLLKIGVKPSAPVDIKYLSPTIIDYFGKLFKGIANFFEHVFFDASAIIVEFLSLYIILPMKKTRHRINTKFEKEAPEGLSLKEILALNTEFETNSFKKKTTTEDEKEGGVVETTTTENESVADTTKDTTKSTTNKTTGGCSGSSCSTTKPTTKKKNGTTKSTTKDKSVVRTRKDSFMSDAEFLSDNVVKIEGVVYGIWKSRPREMAWVEKQINDYSRFAEDPKRYGRNPTTLQDNIQGLSSLQSEMRLHMKQLV